MFLYYLVNVVLILLGLACILVGVGLSLFTWSNQYKYKVDVGMLVFGILLALLGVFFWYLTGTIYPSDFVKPLVGE